MQLQVEVAPQCKHEQLRAVLLDLPQAPDLFEINVLVLEMLLEERSRFGKKSAVHILDLARTHLVPVEAQPQAKQTQPVGAQQTHQ